MADLWLHRSNAQRHLEKPKVSYEDSIGGSGVLNSARPPVKWRKVHDSCDYSTKQCKVKQAEEQQAHPHPHPHQNLSPWLSSPQIDHKYWTDLPPPRTKFTTVVYDGRLIVHGGGLQKAFHSDVYVYHLASNDPAKLGRWECIQEDASKLNGPCPRRSHRAVVRGHEMILFGGRSNHGRVNDVFSLDLNTYEWTNRTPSHINGPAPVERAAHSCVMWRERKMIVYGGDYESKEGCQSYLQDVWELDVNSWRWKELHPVGDIPAARLGHDAAISEDSMFVFGGYQSSRLNDIFVLDLTCGVWRRVWRLHAIKPASFLSMVAVPAKNTKKNARKKHSVRCESLHQLNPDWPYLGENEGALSWTDKDTPNARAASLIIWGGSHADTNSCTDVLLKFDVDTENFEELCVVGEKPPARLGHGMAQHGGNVFLIGGCDNAYYNDMYELDLGQPSLKEIMRHFILLSGIQYKWPTEADTKRLDIDACECESLCDGVEDPALLQSYTSEPGLSRTASSLSGGCTKCSSGLCSAASSSALKQT